MRGAWSAIDLEQRAALEGIAWCDLTCVYIGCTLICVWYHRTMFWRHL